MSSTSPFRRGREEDHRPTLRTWTSDRANALVWRLPGPRRARVLLSQIVFRNPKICATRVSTALEALDEVGIEAVLIGGWGVDALVGEQLRGHSDLDLIVDEHELGRAVAVLGELGFRPWNRDSDPGPIGSLPVAFAQTLRDRALRVVELHGVDLRQVDAAAGTIAGKPVACLSADHQLEAVHRMGRAWTPQRRLSRRRNLAAVESVLQGDVNSA
ncbi:MAG TPA: hypothetical protein VNR67_00575 [Solirubrobacterales bacterium]|nr:hypothetical protein [Solirubrobacterales bacterium]